VWERALVRAVWQTLGGAAKEGKEKVAAKKQKKILGPAEKTTALKV